MTIRRIFKYFLLAFIIPAVGQISGWQSIAQSAESIRLDQIKLPPGFKISLFASGVSGARSMKLSDKGTLFVGTRIEGMVYALPDTNHDFKADRIITIAQNLDMPNGVAFHNGALYVAEVSRIIRFDDIEAHLDDPPKPVTVCDKYPSDHHHGWKFIAFGPDDKLYVPVGAPCNVCKLPKEIYGTITRLNPDGSGLEIYASGVRNTVGFDWNPLMKELWFTDNGRDMLGDNLPPDELNYAPRPGMKFGFPLCFGKNVPDPEMNKAGDCDGDTPTAMDLGPHVASLGMRFYTGNMFPAEYKNQIFIAEHGSWNRSVPIGYRVTIVKLKDNKPVSYEPFAEGWLQGDKVWGRPVDVLVMPDGSLLVSDDTADAIYRITYEK